jgi:translation initiation factor IF-3
LSRPFPPRFNSGPFVRVNGKIRAREVRVIGTDNKQLGVLTLGEALNLARAAGVDLVEVAAAANPPVCRLVDFGKFRYEQAKRDKESKKHQHANKVKEVQLSPKIDPHDLSVKINHAIGFLCEDMKVKVTLKFRGREMAHTEVGFQVIEKFLNEIAPFGHEDAKPKLIGRGINVMISPLPRNKRAKNPNQVESPEAEQTESQEPSTYQDARPQHATVAVRRGEDAENGNNGDTAGFVNNPFSQIEVKR